MFLGNRCDVISRYFGAEAERAVVVPQECCELDQTPAVAQRQIIEGLGRGWSLAANR